MFAFPPKTVFGKTIPKSRIYAHAQPSRRIRDLFTSQKSGGRTSSHPKRSTSVPNPGFLKSRSSRSN